MSELQVNNYKGAMKELKGLNPYDFASEHEVKSILSKYGFLTVDYVDAIFDCCDGIMDYDYLVSFLEHEREDYATERDDILDDGLDLVLKDNNSPYTLLQRYKELNGIIKEIDYALKHSDDDGLYCLSGGPCYDDIEPMLNIDIVNFLGVLLRPDKATKIV